MSTTTTITYGLYDERGTRRRDYPWPDYECSYHLTELLGETHWLSASGDLVPEPEIHRQYLYTRLAVRPDGLTEYQVRERGVHSSATPGETVLSRHQHYAAARRAAVSAAEDFGLVNTGGYGYAWVITDQDGREVTDFQR